ncbi:hypothetical protein HMPREF1547_02655 [Blautia sp. KLE 1732]|jgi:hypothetical protein|nr:hypothetical protein HMPREF1547_02655 [Blautia sp. KLE 1732]
MDTVAWETPARAATSDEVAFFFATSLTSFITWGNFLAAYHFLQSLREFFT